MGNKEKKSLDLMILGNAIKIVTDEDEEYVYKIVSHINKKMEEISKKVKLASNTERMILVTLNIADEYFKSKSKVDSSGNYDESFVSIISMIDDALSSEV